MGKVTAFAVRFSSNQNVFSPGNVISGDLLVELNSAMDMKTVKINFVGRAHVHWTERHSSGSGKNRRTTTRHYSATQNLFEQTIAVFGEGSSDPRRSIPQGQHVFPFNFQLPSPLPSSYEDHIGYIRYHIKGTIVKPWKFDHNTKRIFTVLDALDLNSMPNMMTPSGANGSKSLCCWCCQIGPIEVEFHADRSGYVPGEWISVNATLNNSTNSKVQATSVHLMQKVTYHATSKTKSVWKTLATLNGPNCDRHNTVVWNNERLQIPPVPPSESNHCRIIDISYFLVFEGHLRTCAINLREYAPLTIGTIPLQNLVHGVTGTSPMPSAPPAADPMAAPSAPQQAFGMFAPPPSYAAATGESLNVDVKDDDDNEYTMGDSSYTPQYTFYDWNQSAFTYN